MSWADSVYAIWSALALASGVLWVAAMRGWRLGRHRVGRPAAVVRDMLARRSWLRLLVVLGWIWVGVHSFAR